MTTKHVVGFSGGIDSQAVARWVINRFPAEDVILLNSNAGGNESPVTTEFIEEYSRSVFPVVMIVPLFRDLGNFGVRSGGRKERAKSYEPDQEITFEDLAYLNGRFPSRKAQFCTEYLKLYPSLRWTTENLTERGVDFVRYVGLRRDESEARKNTVFERWDEFFDCTVYYPLADWTKQMCFDYVKAHGEAVNPLYAMGFDRVGCAPCINSGKDDIRNWAARFPQVIDKLRAWEKRVGRTFFPPLLPGGKYGFIDEVVEWAKTSHGGKQYTLPIIESQAGTCVSKYGLCE